MAVVVASGLHPTCINPSLDHRAFRGDCHNWYLLIPVFALSISANRAGGHLLYRQRSRDRRGAREARGRAESRNVRRRWRSDAPCEPQGTVVADQNRTGPVHFVSISGVCQWPQLTHSDYPWQFRIAVFASADEGSTPSPGTVNPLRGKASPNSYPFVYPLAHPALFGRAASATN
jgi:hypothetical protein